MKSCTYLQYILSFASVLEIISPISYCSVHPVNYHSFVSINKFTLTYCHFISYYTEKLVLLKTRKMSFRMDYGEGGGAVCTVKFLTSTSVVFLSSLNVVLWPREQTVLRLCCCDVKHEFKYVRMSASVE